MTQCDRIMHHLQENGSITTLEAFQDYGITRLASRVCDLKQEGYNINKKYETAVNRYGEKVSYIRYSLGVS